MHIYFIPRGILQQLDIFKMFLQTQMFTWKRINIKTGKEELIQVQGALRDCGFCMEYVFPEECLDEVLTMLDFKNSYDRWKISDVKQWFIRKVLGNGVKAMPKTYKETNPNRFINTNGVALHFIGMKKDVRGDMLGYNQEML